MLGYIIHSSEVTKCVWNDSCDNLVRVIRFENKGFNLKPYNSTSNQYGDNAYCHSFSFINIEVADLELTEEKLPINTEIIDPVANDPKWSGCFVFLEHYDPKLLQRGLFIKSGHKKNVALLSRDEKVWVRNTDYRGKKVYGESSVQDSQGTHYYTSPRSEYEWVIMTIDNALERIRKGKNHYGYYPEELTEVYLMEEQVKKLLFHSSSYKYMSLLKLIKHFAGGLK